MCKFWVSINYIDFGFIKSNFRILNLMIIDKVIGIIAPFECLNCGQQGKIVCATCSAKIASSKRSSCFLCNRLTANWRVCASCRHKSKLRGVFVASHYRGQVKTLIGRLKYQRTVGAAGVLAQLLAKEIAKPDQFDLITWVPASSSRYRLRGYNPARLIARSLSKELDIPYAETLYKTGQTSQVGTDRRLRLSQLSGQIYTRRSTLIKHAKILLIDDVVTTGATLNECGRALKTAGAKYIWGAAVAKH